MTTKNKISNAAARRVSPKQQAINGVYQTLARLGNPEELSTIITDYVSTDKTNTNDIKRIDAVMQLTMAASGD